MAAEMPSRSPSLHRSSPTHHAINGGARRREFFLKKNFSASRRSVVSIEPERCFNAEGAEPQAFLKVFVVSEVFHATSQCH